MMYHIRTADGRWFDVKPGKLFTGKVFEEHWFPEHRTDMFEVGFLNPEKDPVPDFRGVPEIGDRIAVDFQQDGPWGSVWYSRPIIEIVEDKDHVAI